MGGLLEGAGLACRPEHLGEAVWLCLSIRPLDAEVPSLVKLEPYTGAGGEGLFRVRFGACVLREGVEREEEARRLAEKARELLSGLESLREFRELRNGKDKCDEKERVLRGRIRDEFMRLALILEEGAARLKGHVRAPRLGGGQEEGGGQSHPRRDLSESPRRILGRGRALSTDTKFLRRRNFVVVDCKPLLSSETPWHSASGSRGCGGLLGVFPLFLFFKILKSLGGFGSIMLRL